MANELEEQFFEAFKIEKPCTRESDVLCSAFRPDGKYRATCGCLDCEYLGDYPQITDHILLGLICMANQHEDYPISTNIKNIQARTLRILLRTEKLYKKYHGSDGRYKKLVKQVRKLFKENSNG